MPRVLGLLARALLVATVLASVALIARLYLNGLLSRVQLQTALADLTGQIGARAAQLAGSWPVLTGVAFLAGSGSGWGLALWWSNGRLRRRPLIMADLRNADMPLADGIRHVRINAFPPVENDGAAMSLILDAAARGRLTLWRRASADTLRRVSHRSIRTVALAMADAVTADPQQADAARVLVLLGADLERLWPRRHGHRDASKASPCRMPLTLHATGPIKSRIE